MRSPPPGAMAGRIFRCIRERLDVGRTGTEGRRGAGGRAWAEARRIFPLRRPDRPHADLHRARHRLGDVERALLLQVLPPPPARASDQGPPGSSRARARTPASSTSATGSPACSRWRATTTPPSSSPTRARRPASAASCATSSPWGRGRSPASTSCASARPSTRRPAIWSRAWSAGIGGYGNSFGVPTVGGSVGFHKRYDGNILVNAFAVGVARADAIFYRQGDRRREPDRLSRLEDRPRRHPRRDHGLGRLRGGRRGEAADGAGRRSVRREAAARGLPRADGLGRGRRHPGHGRGRPHLLGGRDGGEGRSRGRARPRRRAVPRGRHDAPTR